MTAGSKAESLGVDQEGVPLRSTNQQQEPEPTQPESLIAYSCNYCGLGSVCHCDEEDDYDDDRPRDCFWCAGDGWVECDDPIQCTSPHNRFGECPCSSCGGSGDARDMTVW